MHAKTITDLLVVAAALGLSEAALSENTKTFITRIIAGNGAAATSLSEAEQRMLNLVSWAEVDEWLKVDRSPRTPLQIALLAASGSRYLTDKDRKKKEKSLVPLERTLSISAATKLVHLASSDHAAAKERLIDNGLAAARGGVLAAAAPLREALERSNLRERYRLDTFALRLPHSPLLTRSNVSDSPNAGPKSCWKALRRACDVELAWRRVRDEAAVPYTDADLVTLLKERGTPWQPGVEVNLKAHACETLYRQWWVAIAKRARNEEGLNKLLPIDAAATIATYVKYIANIDARLAQLEADTDMDAAPTAAWCMDQELREATVAALMGARAAYQRRCNRATTRWSGQAARRSEQDKATPNLPFDAALVSDVAADVIVTAADLVDDSDAEGSENSEDSGDDSDGSDAEREEGGGGGDFGVISFSDSDDDGTAFDPVEAAAAAAISVVRRNIVLTDADRNTLRAGTWLNDEVRYADAR